LSSYVFSVMQGSHGLSLLQPTTFDKLRPRYPRNFEKKPDFLIRVPHSGALRQRGRNRGFRSGRNG
ncbi:MAG: hypothetical protein KA338_09325, partial [Chloroflexi bacterium]|nr:hypothetical protein [Chloroflexota bacterium]